MSSKIIPLSRLGTLARRLHAARKKIVFTNGTFDLLHLGHVTYLEKARALGQVLVVGVNSDRSVKSYKDPSRPLNHEKDRVRVLSALACVDYAVIFNDPTPIRLIEMLKPKVLVKGADWEKSQIAGAREVESWGGKVVRVRLVPNRSTTRLIRLISGGSGK